MAPGQKFGPQSPGQPWTDKPYDNLDVSKNKPEYAKKDSGHLRFPLEQVHAVPHGQLWGAWPPCVRRGLTSLCK